MARWEVGRTSPSSSNNGPYPQGQFHCLGVWSPSSSSSICSWSWFFPPGTLQAFYKLFSELLLNVRITCITCKTARLHLEQSEDKVYGDSFSNYSAISFLKKIARTLKLFAPLSRNVFLHPRACAKNFKLPPVPLYFIFALIGVAPLSSWSRTREISYSLEQLCKTTG